MAFLGDLIVNMGVNPKGMTSGLNSAKSGLSKFTSMASSFLTPVTIGFAAVTAAAASAGAAVYVFAGRIEVLAGVADKAVQTGISGKFIQQLGYAADQSGISVDTLTTGIKNLTVLIGKGDSKPFDKLGVNLAEIKSLSPEKQFLAIASAISKMPTAAERAAAAVRVFGKSGIEMTGLFAGGMNDLNALLADAEKLGIGISAEGLAKATAADDAIQRMKASFGALLDQITVGVAPAFEMIATKIADWIPPVTKFFDKFNGLEDKIGFAGDLLAASMDVGIETIKAHWAEMLNEMVDQVKSIPWEKLLNPFAGIKFEDLKVGDQGQGLAAAQQRLQGVMGRLGPDDQGLIRGKLPVMGGKPERQPVDGSKLRDLAGGLAEGAMSLFDKAALAAQSKMTDLQLKGEFGLSVLKNMFGVGPGSDAEKKKAMAQNEPPQLAGAMQRGSQEAYSTIVQAIIKTKDPVVKATEKQTKQLVAAINKNGGQKVKLVAEFAV